MILPEELEGVPFLQGLDEPHRNRIAELAAGSIRLVPFLVSL